MKIIHSTFIGFLALTATASAAKPALSIKNDLSYDGNGKLTAHNIFYPADNPLCPAASFTAPEGFVKTPLSGQALQQVFPGYEEGSGDCPAACQERGVDKSVAHAVMPHRHTTDEDGFADWFESTCHKTEICLMNYHSKEAPLKLMWVNPSGQEVLHMEIEYGERKTRCFNSFIGHKFNARDGSTGEIVDSFKIEYMLSRAIGVSPPSGDPTGHNFDKEIESTLHNEWRKHTRINRTFSPLGFKKARLPEDVFASMGSFWYNNRQNDVREEWDGKGVFVNWWESDCYFVQAPWGVKAIWQDRLRLLVEAWAQVPVEQTDMYGMRKYVEGARLLAHVDRETTHAVSLIVNIDQGNMTEPWPIEVNDHGDRLHEVLMTPGDIVYYESAKAIHGRSRPLTGKDAYYVNLFTHYRPVGDPKWMEKPNPDNVPEPVIEVEGDCRLEAVGMTELPDKRLGVVEAVKCDDPRLGATISPTLYKANGGEDLLAWWEKTGENRPAAKRVSAQ